VNWEKGESEYFIKSDEGYLICRSGKAESTTYTAWTPANKGWEQGKRPHYENGDQVPWPRESIGIFTDSKTAKEACQQHWESKTNSDLFTGDN